MSNKAFQNEILELTRHHRNACKAYDDICNGTSGIWDADPLGPFLPVSIFKDLDLCSVPMDQIKRQLTSSGTTGQNVSKIYLDAETSAAQQRALCEIVGEYIGPKRIPMLIIDSPDVLRDRSKYSARGAGIMGFSMMASKRFYALNNDMNLDWDSIRTFIETAGGGPCFAFGFTYMIWQYFYGGLKAAQESGANTPIDLSNCYLIHGGGWKKLADKAVSNEAFKEGLKSVCGIEKVSDYYGMAEQTGSIFMECECGHLHASPFSDITALNPDDFSECAAGEWGLLSLTSILPWSYPGHRLMTEDWGRILGEDDCPCGRPGKYFEVQGRIPKAEIRGCSDTFAQNREAKDGALEVLAGTYPIETGVYPAQADTHPAQTGARPCFDETMLRFLEDLSATLTKEAAYRRIPELYALGFWCRPAHLQKLKERQANQSHSHRNGKGLVLHIAPSNMPTMFAYSWITSLLAGNSNVVRISSRMADISGLLLDAIRSVLERPEYAGIKAQNSFIQCPRGDCTIEELSKIAAGRVIWGGDETVKTITEIPAAEGCVDIGFPDKYSIAVLDATAIAELDDDELQAQVHRFYNDTYGADQNACSSPRTVFWVNGSAGDTVAVGTVADKTETVKTDQTAIAKNRWWEALAKEAERYDLEAWMATEKYRELCNAYATIEGLGPVRNWGNRLYVIPCVAMDAPLWKWAAKLGTFYEWDVDAIEDIASLLDAKIQTVVTNIEGLSLDVDRVVAIGEALDFDTVWDRKDIIELLSK